MEEQRAADVGAALRRVPGLPFILDQRVAMHRRREERAAQRREAALVQRDRELLARLAGRTDLRINVGSSGEHIDGWISADLLRDPVGQCLVMDATQPWPFADGSAMAINAEHMIEHLAREDAPAMLREAFRVLRPGGLLRVSTPDLEGIARAYLARDPAVLAAHREHGYSARDHADLLNNYAYLWDHRQLYDFALLRALLEEAGFADIERAAFGESRHSDLQGIDRHDPGELAAFVVCVDAVRP